MGLDPLTAAILFQGGGSLLDAIFGSEGGDERKDLMFDRTIRPLFDPNFRPESGSFDPNNLFLRDARRRFALRERAHNMLANQQGGQFNPFADFSSLQGGGFGFNPGSSDTGPINNLEDTVPYTPPEPPVNDQTGSPDNQYADFNPTGPGDNVVSANVNRFPDIFADNIQQAIIDEIGRGRFQIPDFSGPFNPNGQINFFPAANGFRGTVDDPTLFLAGEAGPEQVNITPSGSGAQTGRGTEKQNFNVATPEGRAAFEAASPKYHERFKQAQAAYTPVVGKYVAGTGAAEGQQVINDMNRGVGTQGVAPGNPPPNDPSGGFGEGFLSPDLVSEIQRNALFNLQNVPTIEDFIGNLGEFVTSDINELSAARGAFGGSANQQQVAQGLGRLRLEGVDRRQQAQRDAVSQALASSGLGFNQAMQTFGANRDDMISTILAMLSAGNQPFS